MENPLQIKVRELRPNFPDHPAVHIGQLAIQPIVIKLQLIIVQTKDVQHRGIKLPHIINFIQINRGGLFQRFFGLISSPDISFGIIALRDFAQPMLFQIQIQFLPELIPEYG